MLLKRGAFKEYSNPFEIGKGESVIRKGTVFILHRTQGKGVEAVHLLGVAKGFGRANFKCHVVSPPGVVVSANEPKKGNVSHLAKYSPQLLFELMEIASNWAMKKALRRSHKEAGCVLLYERYAFMGWSGSSHARKWNVPHVLEVNYTSEDELDVPSFLRRPIYSHRRQSISQTARYNLPQSNYSS